MRIHANTLTHRDLFKAAQIARVDYDVTEHGSRSRDHAFDVKLEGESRRRPNGGASGAGSGYAATWDQWGVFLSILFDRDPSVTCWAYVDRDEFHARTAHRFNPDGNDRTDGSDYWPNDAHGDHTFRFAGCTKCTARQIWGPR